MEICFGGLPNDEGGTTSMFFFTLRPRVFYFWPQDFFLCLLFLRWRAPCRFFTLLKAASGGAYPDLSNSACVLAASWSWFTFANDTLQACCMRRNNLNEVNDPGHSKSHVLVRRCSWAAAKRLWKVCHVSLFVVSPSISALCWSLHARGGGSSVLFCAVFVIRYVIEHCWQLHCFYVKLKLSQKKKTSADITDKVLCAARFFLG